MPLVYDQALYAAIQQIKAVDAHAHPMPFCLPEPDEAERPDPLGEAMFPYPVRLRTTHPEYMEAWRALYGYPYEDMATEHAREALKAKVDLMRQMGERYPAWVLDQAGVETMLADLPGLGPGQVAPRFQWVVRIDGLLTPFAPDQGALHSMGKEIDPAKTPPTLDAYLDQVVHPRLTAHREAGAVAIKSVFAYWRTLDIADVPAAEAEAIYAQRLQSGVWSPSADKALQDYLFRHVARQAGQLGLVLQIHTGVGADPYFDVSGCNPMLLEPVFNDVSLRDTKFVIVHGGWPFERQAGVMMIKPNVYADFSSQTFLRSTRALSRTLEEWLEWYPEKVLYGSDAYPEDTPLANWEEKAWLSARTGRQALAIALTRMMQDGQIARARAEELAEMVLRGNARRLYGLV